MNTYIFSYYSHEDSDSIEMHHEEKYTDDQLKEIFSDAAKEMCMDYISGKVVKGGLTKNHPLSHVNILRLFGPAGRISDISSMSDLFPGIKYYLAKRGFVSVKYAASFSVFGWHRFEADGFWEEQEEDTFERSLWQTLFDILKVE